MEHSWSMQLAPSRDLIGMKCSTWPSDVCKVRLGYVDPAAYHYECLTIGCSSSSTVAVASVTRRWKK